MCGKWVTSKGQLLSLLSCAANGYVRTWTSQWMASMVGVKKRFSDRLQKNSERSRLVERELSYVLPRLSPAVLLCTLQLEHLLMK